MNAKELILALPEGMIKAYDITAVDISGTVALRLGTNTFFVINDATINDTGDSLQIRDQRFYITLWNSHSQYHLTVFA